MAGMDVLPIFQEENVVREEISGLLIQPDGSWSQGEEFDTESYIKKFVLLENTVVSLDSICAGKIDITAINGTIMAEKADTQSFDSEGKIPTKLFECPCCGEKVDKLLSNGYCSKTCAMKDKAERAKKKVSAAGEKTLEIIKEIQGKLQLLDMALNVITMIPEMLRDYIKLPEEYRDYVILRIEILFLKLKKIVNNIEIGRNDKMVELMKKIKFKSIDEKLSVILAPINAVIATIISLQQALNTALASIIVMLQNPAFGSIEPNGGHGFVMTAKSIQYPETSSDIFVENKPSINMIVDMPAMLSTIDFKKIDNIIKTALPPIQEPEYFLDPVAFKARFAFSSDNAPKVKKMCDLLQFLVVQCPGECFPRYRNLKLTRVFFVLAILTGWGPLTQKIFGDFIFHGSI